MPLLVQVLGNALKCGTTGVKRVCMLITSSKGGWLKMYCKSENVSMLLKLRNVDGVMSKVTVHHTCILAGGCSERRAIFCSLQIMMLFLLPMQRR